MNAKQQRTTRRKPQRYLLREVWDAQQRDLTRREKVIVDMMLQVGRYILETGTPAL